MEWCPSLTTQSSGHWKWRLRFTFGYSRLTYYNQTVNKKENSAIKRVIFSLKIELVPDPAGGGIEKFCIRMSCKLKNRTCARSCRRWHRKILHSNELYSAKKSNLCQILPEMTKENSAFKLVVLSLKIELVPDPAGGYTGVKERNNYVVPC